MPRKITNKVEYFSHDVKHGQTMFILESKYGNDGYAFWFKLLECLGDSEGHYMDLCDEAAMLFLQAKTRLSWELTVEILDLLAKLHAINQEMWKRRIVWSDNFVQRLEPVYINRRRELPEPPLLHVEMIAELDNYSRNDSDADVPTAKSTQSKGKERKVKESIYIVGQSPDDADNFEEEIEEVKEKPPPKPGKNGEKNSAKIHEIIDFLNEQANTHFAYFAKGTIKQINGRLSEGFEVDDFKRVITVKVDKWKGTEWEDYLRPETIFCAKHFDSYKQEYLREKERINGT